MKACLHSHKTPKPGLKYSLTNNVSHSRTVCKCSTESLHIPLNIETAIQEDSLVHVVGGGLYVGSSGWRNPPLEHLGRLEDTRVNRRLIGKHIVLLPAVE